MGRFVDRQHGGADGVKATVGTQFSLLPNSARALVGLKRLPSRVSASVSYPETEAHGEANPGTVSVAVRGGRAHNDGILHRMARIVFHSRTIPSKGYQARETDYVLDSEKLIIMSFIVPSVSFPDRADQILGTHAAQCLHQVDRLHLTCPETKIVRNVSAHRSPTP
jgi:hypothetical protein